MILTALLLGLLPAQVSVNASPAAGHTPTTPDAVPNQPPIIRDDLGPHPVLNLPGDGAWSTRLRPLRIRLTITDPEGDRVTVRPVQLPEGVVFQPITNQPSPVVCEVVWSPPAAGPILEFEAFDEVDPSARVRHRIRLSTGEESLTGAYRADVTGDGVPDAISFSGRLSNSIQTRILVWEGGSSSQTPLATLKVDVPGIGSNGMILDLVADVTGDGIADIIASADEAKVGAPSFAGAIFVWAGGSALSGTLSPTAILTAAPPIGGTYFGRSGVHVEDVTGDGIADVVSGSPNLPYNGVVGAGLLLVFAGGPGLTGTPAPHATLFRPAAVTDDELGIEANHDVPIRLEDVTGDGLRDVIAFTRIGNDKGQIHVWKGGRTMVGPLAPIANLREHVSGQDGGDFDDDLLIADVTGDGQVDIVAPAPDAKTGAGNAAGAVYVWEGGPSLAGNPVYTARLEASGDSGATPLRETRLADMNRDGILDIVSTAPVDTWGGETAAGAIYVWMGGAGLVGVRSETSRLAATVATQNDFLGTRVWLLDADGDGWLDVVSASEFLTDTPTQSLGENHFWPGLATYPADYLDPVRFDVARSSITPSNQVLTLEDITGDPSPELILSLSCSLRIWDLQPNTLGNVPPIAIVQGVFPAIFPKGLRLPRIVDVNGDGVADIVAGAPLTQVDGVNDAGVIAVEFGKPALEAFAPPDVVLRATSPGLNDLLPARLEIADVDGDGLQDIVAGAPNKQTGLAGKTGMVLIWLGRTNWNAIEFPDFELTYSPSQPMSSGLGSQGLIVTDWTGDGLPDVLAVSPNSTLDSTPFTGGLYLWEAPISAATPATFVLHDPTAEAASLLGL